ncbi:MAG: DUF4198 domain-containing protein [bacterium]
MKRVVQTALFIICFMFMVSTFIVSTASAHFQMLLPSDNIISQSDSKTINLDIIFFHPFEGHYMNMEKPVQFGVLAQGNKKDLLPSIKSKKEKGCSTFEAEYSIKRPGDHIFYVEPQPYWEPEEDCFIIHYTKVVVNAFGMEEGWDEEVGFETEIMPLTRPYGLWAGNVFQGVVKLKGKPVPFAEVEVEYYNKDGKIKAPDDPFITQVIKADQDGVFTYAMPKAGWWAFAALNEADRKLKGPEGKDKSIEIGALIWVKVEDMK